MGCCLCFVMQVFGNLNGYGQLSRVWYDVSVKNKCVYVCDMDETKSVVDV